MRGSASKSGWVLAGALTLSVGCTSSAAALECGKQLLYASVPMTPTRSNVMTIPISLNGVEEKMLLDTGGAVSQLSRKTITELGLRDTESPIRLYGIDGAESRTHTSVDQIGIGILKGRNLYFQVTPWSDFGSESGTAGVLALDLMQRYDIDLDFGANKLNFISQDHCPGSVVYWQAPAVAVVPMRINDQNHIELSVTIDGHPVKAMIDTGATRTIMNMEVAKRAFGITPDSPGLTESGSLDGDPKMKIYTKIFDSLAFEGVTISHPRIELMPDEMNKNADHSYQTGSSIKRFSDSITLPPVIIGMNLLTKLHVYIAFKEQKLYITPAAPAAPANPVAR